MHGNHHAGHLLLLLTGSGPGEKGGPMSQDGAGDTVPQPTPRVPKASLSLGKTFDKLLSSVPLIITS